MKKILILFSLAALVSCTKSGEHINNFDVAGDMYDQAEGVVATWERQTFSITVSPDVSSKWTARSVSADTWCTFSQKSGELVITLAENRTDFPRETAITLFTDGEYSQQIRVRQAYYRFLDLNLPNNTFTVGAAADSDIKLPVSTNVSDPIAATPSAASGWITSAEVENGMLVFGVERNSSTSASRTGVITLVAGELTATLTVVQNELWGYDYKINLDAVDFNESPVWEIYDAAHSRLVGQICREYLLKVDENTLQTIVRSQETVVYPYTKEGSLDLQNGFVVSNGGRVSWNNAATTGYTVMSSYIAGELTATPTIIYFHAGGSKWTSVAPEEATLTPALRAYLIVDDRSGEANTAGEMTEHNVYKVVKIGTQYWMAENLRTSRFRDGANIPTNISSANWQYITTPGCLVGGATSSTCYIDANSAAAATGRATYGCLYNFSAITNRDLSSPTLISGLQDRISPTGWGVPLREEWEKLVNYVLQGASSTTTNYLYELSSVGSTERTNITLFSAKGGASRGVRTGAFNGGCYYGTMSYSIANVTDATNGVPTATPMHHYTTILVAAVTGASTQSVYNTHISGVGNFVRCIKR